MSVHFSTANLTSLITACGAVTDTFNWQASMKLIDAGTKNSDANSTPSTKSTSGGTLGIVLLSEDEEVMLSRCRIEPIPAETEGPDGPDGPDCPDCPNDPNDPAGMRGSRGKRPGEASWGSMRTSTGITAKVSLHVVEFVGSQRVGVFEEGNAETRVVLFKHGERAGKRRNGVFFGDGGDHVAERADRDGSEEMGRELAKMTQRDGRRGRGRRESGGRRERGRGERIELVEQQSVAEFVVELEKGEVIGVGRSVRKNVRFEARFEDLQVNAVELRTIRRRQHPTLKTWKRGNIQDWSSSSVRVKMSLVRFIADNRRWM